MYTNKTFAGSFTTPTELHSAKLETALKINENQMQEENIDYEDLYQESFEDIKEEINIDAKTTDEGYKINKVKCKNDINSKLYVGQIIKKGNIICSDREKDIVEARYIIKKYLGLMLKRNLLILFWKN